MFALLRIKHVQGATPRADQQVTQPRFYTQNSACPRRRHEGPALARPFAPVGGCGGGGRNRHETKRARHFAGEEVDELDDLVLAERRHHRPYVASH